MRSRSRWSSQDGFTLTEVLAASLLLLVGILGVAGSLNISRDSINRSEVREASAHRAEREIERVRALPYTSLGLTAAPAPSTTAGSPDAQVRSGNQYQWDTRDATKVEPLVLGGTVQTSQTFDDGRLTGTIHVYITAYDDPALTTPVPARRVTVAVVPGGAWTLPQPVVASTVVPAPAT